MKYHTDFSINWKLNIPIYLLEISSIDCKLIRDNVSLSIFLHCVCLPVTLYWIKKEWHKIKDDRVAYGNWEKCKWF